MITGFLLLLVAIALSVRTFVINKTHKNLFKPPDPLPDPMPDPGGQVPPREAGGEDEGICCPSTLSQHFLPIASALFAISGG